MNVTIPKYIEALPKEQQQFARTKFLVKLAALHATPEGTIIALSVALGLSKNTLSALLNRGPNACVFSPKMCNLIERHVGRSIVPREMLNPEVFGTNDDASEA